MWGFIYQRNVSTINLVFSSTITNIRSNWHLKTLTIAEHHHKTYTQEYYYTSQMNTKLIHLTVTIWYFFYSRMHVIFFYIYQFLLHITCFSPVLKRCCQPSILKISEETLCTLYCSLYHLSYITYFYTWSNMENNPENSFTR